MSVDDRIDQDRLARYEQRASERRDPNAWEGKAPLVEAYEESLDLINYLEVHLGDIPQRAPRGCGPHPLGVSVGGLGRERGTILDHQELAGELLGVAARLETRRIRTILDHQELARELLEHREEMLDFACLLAEGDETATEQAREVREAREVRGDPRFDVDHNMILARTLARGILLIIERLGLDLDTNDKRDRP